MGEDLDAVVAGVGDISHQGCIQYPNYRALRRRKIPVVGAKRTYLEIERVAVEYLNSVVAGVGDGDVMSKALAYRSRTLKLPVAVATRTDHPIKHARQVKVTRGKTIPIKPLDAVVAGVGDIDAASAIKGDAARRRKVPVAGAARAKAEGVGAVGAEELDAVVAGVGDGDRAA